MSSGFVSTFGGTFFQWFQTDVLPYIIGSVSILVFIATLVLDIILIVTLKKRDMLKFPCNRFVLELAIMDIVAAVFIVLITIIVAFMKSWELSTYVCNAHAVLILWFYLVTFGLLTILFVERTVKIKKPEMYEKYFQSSRCVSLLSFAVWTVDLGIASIALTSWTTIEYNFFHAACAVKYVDNVYYMSLVFVIGIGIATIACVICYYIIIKHKLDKGNSKDKNKSKDTPETIQEEGESTAVSKNPFAMAASGGKNKFNLGSKSGSDGNGTGASGAGAKPKNKLALMAARKKIKKAAMKAKFTKMFSLTDDKKDPDFHMAVTYLIVFCLMLVCYVPYFSIHFADYNDSGEIWGGYYTITVILVMVSYCMKPIIYLSHNRHYRKGYKETIPEKVVVKATSVTESFGKMMDKLDKVMFKSPGKKKLDATLTTKMKANKWLSKVRNKKKGGLAGGKSLLGGNLNKMGNPAEKSKATPRSGASTASPTKVTMESAPGNNTDRSMVNHPGAVMMAGTSVHKSNTRGTKPPIVRQNSWGEFVDETVPGNNIGQNVNYTAQGSGHNPYNKNSSHHPAPVRRQDSWGDFVDEPAPKTNNYNNSSYQGGNVGRRDSMSPGSKMVAVGINNRPHEESYQPVQPQYKSKMSSINSNSGAMFNGYPINGSNVNDNYNTATNSFEPSTYQSSGSTNRRSTHAPSNSKAEDEMMSLAFI